jgi:alpha-amylase/alpha-mannosidase (GH57 family)
LVGQAGYKLLTANTFWIIFLRTKKINKLISFSFIFISMALKLDLTGRELDRVNKGGFG